MKVLYNVLNAQLVQTSKQIEFEGQSATLTVERMVVEALPLDGVSGTLTLNLPSDTIVAEGDTITVLVGEAE
ncbi:hypothetical protein D3Y57_19315 [Sphingomonas paeninsulae]|uniref:Uncharacterized protein n=1 Tax=Sphingomonas paeninsulae TaxID=2319844 RepID=A0A494TKX7_SPHPE|nr:hypothetical protein [Sphingomonas paeninsulae]AYJ87683.1 hypothetical protein D3Y57_19315 [Sphingomonas paeninsulae]